MNETVAQHWVWVIDVVYGAIIGMAYAKLDDALQEKVRRSKTAAIMHIACATGFLSFVVYHVCAYHLLISRFPYTISAYSGFRYALDLMMLFLVMVIVTRALASEPEQSMLTILAALTAWHVGAAMWHFAATLEHERHLPKLIAYLPHFFFISGYWTIFATWWLIAKRQSAIPNIQSRSLLYAISAAVFIVSIVRYAQLINAFT